MTTQPGQEPGTARAAEAPTEPGYGNDTGFAEEAEAADDTTPDTTSDDPDSTDASDVDITGEGDGDTGGDGE
ncbi:hypothetical protein [Kineococcus terrestris]|uniref:hypothetical protein n=1 Tax=Kineococcus terrestris TaxID=2044856 RepID=UPI0034DB25CE